MLDTHKIRNFAIIAHVDHGKTTLVNNILKQTNTFRDNKTVEDRIMDSNDLEKERGITILAKVTSVFYEDYKFNIVDTPGHADFGGEVERILSMVDGVILLVDSAEGVLPQTKFVLDKSLKLGLKPIVVINKVDRQDERCSEVLDEVENLFLDLNANEEQLFFPVLYAVGRDGWATSSYEDAKKIVENKQSGNLEPLFKLIEEHIEEPKVDTNKPFEMLATILSSDKFLGKILIGKIYNGTAEVNKQVKILDLEGKLKGSAKLTKLFSFKGIQKYPIDNAVAGDIVAIAGIDCASVSDTPTMYITIKPNDSPFVGTEGQYVTSGAILERLKKEEKINVSIKINVSNNNSFEVGGRGELQLAVLVETMRREGFELCIGRPKVIFKEENGKKLEPIEEVIIDIKEEFNGIICQKLLERKGICEKIESYGTGRLKMTFHIPSRSLIGYQSEFKNDTHGDGIMNRSFYSYSEYKGDIKKTRNGVLISSAKGITTIYSLDALSDRGTFFVGPGVSVYEGMIVGECNKTTDLEINPVKTKELTNMRSATADIAAKAPQTKKMSLEEAISYIQDGELVEVTPKSIRLRKEKLKR